MERRPAKTFKIQALSGLALGAKLKPLRSSNVDETTSEKFQICHFSLALAG